MDIEVGLTKCFRCIIPINEKDGEKLKIMLGPPCGTRIYQTGNARSNNSYFKIHTYLKKTKVLANKRRLFNFHSGINLNKADIFPLLILFILNDLKLPTQTSLQ